jgi:DNA gyrase inhibitor GyrI
MTRTRWTGLTLVLSGSLAAAHAAAQAPALPAKPPAPPAAPAPPSANRVATLEALHVLALPMKGSYMQHQAAFERLGALMSSKGITPLGPPLGRYFSAPDTPEADLAWEVAFPVDAGVKAEAPFEVKDIPGGLTAIHVHKGPYEDLGTAWPAFMEWVMSSGHQPAGPPMNVFQGQPGDSPQVELRMPVVK